MRRKLFVISLLLITGAVSAIYIEKTGPALTLFLLAGASAILIWSRTVGPGMIAALLAGLILVSALNIRIEDCRVGLAESRRRFDAVVCEARERPGGRLSLICRLRRPGVKAVIDCRCGDLIWTDLIGCDISFSASLQEPETASNPRCFDYRNYLYGRGVYFCGSAVSVAVRGTEEHPLLMIRRLIIKKREAFLDAFAGDREARALLAGILFGDTGAMPEELTEEFRANGTAHVLAVSGLHIGILYAAYKALLRRLGGAGKALVPLFGLFLLIYASCAMWTASVTRASALIFMKVLADMTDRRFDMLSGLSGIIIVMTVLRPYAVTDTGLQMSFLAVMGISFVPPVLAGRVGRNISVLIGVQLVMMPYGAFVFDHLSPVAFIMNPVVIFLAGLIVPLGAGSFALYGFTGLVMPFMSALEGCLVRLLVSADHLAYAGGIFDTDLCPPPPALQITYFMLLFFLSSEYNEIYVRHRRSARRELALLAVMLAVAAAAFTGGRTPFDSCELVFVDVGQGDSLHLRWQGGRDLLIDGGGAYWRNTGKDVLKPYLLKNGTRSIDLAIATHLHMDHYKGLQELEGCFDVRRIKSAGEAGELISGNDREYIEVLWPLPENAVLEDENYCSMVLKVHEQGVTVLITADLTAEGEAALLDRYAGTDVLNCDILKVAHHGSRSSTTDGFLRAVSPEAAVICVGRNSYGHPAPEVIEKLEDNGIIVYRTDRDGAVGIDVEGRSFTVCTMKGTRTDRYLRTLRPTSCRG